MKKNMFKKQSIKNPFGILSIIVIFINYILIYISYYVQNSVRGMLAWNLSGTVLVASLLITAVVLITHIVLIIVRKIKLPVFLIGMVMNSLTLIFCLCVIGDRI